MLTKALRQDRPVLILLCPLLVLFLWPGSGAEGLPWNGGALAPWMTRGMPLFRPVAWLLALHPLSAMAVSMLCVTVLGHRLDRVGNDSELFERRNHLSSMLLPLLLGLLPHGLVPGPAMVAALPMLLAVSRPWHAMSRPEAPGRLFDAGLLLGVAALIYLPYAFLVVVVWASLAVTRPLQWREYVLPGLGMGAVLFLGWGVVRLCFPGTWAPAWSMYWPEQPPPVMPMHWMFRVALLTFLGVFGLAVLYTFRSVYARSIIRVQNIRASFLAFTFTMGLLALFSWWLHHRVPATLLAVPAAMLGAFPLLHARRTGWPDAAWWCLLLLVFWERYAPW